MSDQDYREVDPDEVVDISDEVIDEVTDKNKSTEDKKDNKPTEFCYICHRPDNITGPLIKMAPGMSVCTDCMQRTFDSMGGFGFGGGDNSKSNVDMSKMPNISFLNLGSLFGEGPKVKNAHGTQSADKEDRPAPAIDINNIIPPHKIKEKLDEYVVGQDYAKKVMSVAVYNHYKRVATGTMDDIEIEKSNMLMLGPTGSGKTYLVRTLARLLDVPLAITDATSLTEAGYIGDDIESVVSKLLAAAGNDVERCQQGIIFIDEIDKLAKKKNTNQRDVSGESVQQGMLKLLEGADVEVPIGASSKNAMVPTTTINTRNILFICGGAFPAMDEIIKARLNKHSSMGFMADLKDKYDEDKNILQKVTVEDLREFGMIPEFIGRLPIVFATEMLDEDMLVRILKEPKNAIIKQYQKLLELDEVKLEFEEGALHAIAKKALDKKLGARGLRSIIEEFMLDIMYEIPKDENIGQVIITEDYIEKKGGPRILLRTTGLIPEKAAAN
ncbi:ATP-dependent Clp protease ATP-binding subunit ClpX [Pseudobutyrivibrio ruminis]|uniref:ATP-dependent Clp protease ATP-binding subunit ClpX n=1 Tax=Pseudobutyrivibrio ruminis TaxID=46206 RepID=UPI0004177E89|nr:ATP-dependent Clp protease ATP-binding subunit ClpX [Pseudobutyrivibrio ruminis]